MYCCFFAYLHLFHVNALIVAIYSIYLYIVLFCDNSKKKLLSHVVMVNTRNVCRRFLLVNLIEKCFYCSFLFVLTLDCLQILIIVSHSVIQTFLTLKQNLSLYVSNYRRKFKLFSL